MVILLINLIGIPAMTVFAEENINIEFIVVIDGTECSVDEINLRPGEIFNVTAKITPETNETSEGGLAKIYARKK